MFSIPSFEAEAVQDNAKDLVRSSLSTLSSLSSNGDNESPNMSKKEDVSMKIDWESVEENVMKWFT